MKKAVIFALLLIVFLNLIYAECSNEQININTASATELDKITYVGPATAESIISARPFSSVDDLIRVSGIGEIKLEAIKTQGLACIENTDIEPEEEEKIEEDETETQKEVEKNEIAEEEILVINPKKDAIKLSPQTIKSEENNSNLNKNNYAIYGLVIFCILLGGLFLAKKIKFKERKNEFE